MMDYHRQAIGSAKLIGIFDLPPTLRNRKVEVIILPAENDVDEKPDFKCHLGFLDIPPLPNSFFDPLSEEDLQAWGL